MSLAALRTEVAACRAWERSLHAGSPETRRAAAMPGRWELWIPFVLPLYGLVGWSTGARFDNEWWVAVIPWWWLASFGRLFPRTQPTEWEALRLPSRRGWMLARWSLRIRGWLWLSACTLAHHLLLGLRDGGSFEGIRWPVAAGILIAPFLLAALMAWFPLQSRACGGRSWAAPLLALVLGLGFQGIAIAAWTQREAKPDKAWIVFWAFSASAGVLLLLTAPSLEALRRSVARSTGGTGLRGLISHGVVGFSGLLAGTLLVPCLLAPAILLGAGTGPVPDPAYAAALGAVVLGTLLASGGALRLVGTTDVGIEARPQVKVAKRAVPAGTSAAPAGRGLRAAAWALYSGEWRRLQHPWLTFLPRLLWECRTPACGFLAVFLGASGGHHGGFQGFLSLWMFLLVLLLIPRPLHLPASRRLHLLGADFSAVASHNLRWGLFLEVLPAVLGGAVVFLPYFERYPLPPRVGGFLVATTVILLRQGPDIAPFLEIARWLGGWPTAALFAGAVTGWFLDAPTTLLIVGTVLFAVAVELSVRVMRNHAEAGRRIEARAADD